MFLQKRTYGVADNKALILLHGLYGCSDHWVGFGKYWASRGRYVIIPDMRNQGNSPHSEEHSFELMAADIKNMMEEMGIETADFVGHSMGGNLTTLLAILYPRLVDKMVVIDVCPKNYSECKSDQFDEHLKVLESLCQINMAQFKSWESVKSFLAEKINKKKYQDFILKNIKRGERGFQWRSNIPNYKVLINSVKDFPLQEFEIKHESLFIKGELSDFILEEDMSFINARFPNSKLEILEKSKHWCHVQQPEKFIDLVNQHLKIN